jgi:hypothetical protein
LLEVGTKLVSLRQAIAHLATFIPEAERNPAEVLTASNIMTKAAEQDGPVRFACISTLQASTAFDPARKDTKCGRRKVTATDEVAIQVIEEAVRPPATRPDALR